MRVGVASATVLCAAYTVDFVQPAMLLFGLLALYALWSRYIIVQATNFTTPVSLLTPEDTKNTQLQAQVRLKLVLQLVP